MFTEFDLGVPEWCVAALAAQGIDLADVQTVRIEWTDGRPAPEITFQMKATAEHVVVELTTRPVG